MQKLSTYFFSDFRYRSQATWFKRFLYIFLILESLYYLAYYDILFGDHSLVFVTPKFIGFFKSAAYILYNSGSADLSRYFILAVLLLSLTNLFFTKFYFFGDFLIWLLVINLHNRIYPALTGGDNLMVQFLFFNCFLSASFAAGSSWQNQLRACLHNIAVIGIMLQICLVYLLSGLAKLGDEGWIKGQAIISVSQIRHFSLFSFLNYSGGSDLVFIFLNYVVLAYQLLFPLLIWIKKIKKPLLILGILMHLYIAFVMGLVAFGCVMILAYTFFWPPKEQVS